MNARFLTGLLLIALLTGCATTSDVQRMIDENSRQIAAEQLHPAVSRLDDLIEETAARLQALNVQIGEMEYSLEQKMVELQTAIVGDKMAASQRMDQITGQIETLQASVDQQIAQLRTMLDEEQERTGSRIQSLTRTLEKTQENLGLTQERMNEMQGLYSQQKDELESVRALLDTQKDSLLQIFRKQKDDLTGIISELDRQLERAVSGELTAPDPAPAIEPDEE